MERRLAAILAADVVGYSRLMGVDEAGTLAALNAHRSELIDAKIAEHQGRIVKLTGDGMLVEFSSVVSAVACAADIQRSMHERNAKVAEDRRIEFRIGINLGDVIVEDGDIFGDGVNVAARLEGIAKPGGIAVSETVRDHIGNRLDLIFEGIGEHVLKNIDHPVKIFSVFLDAPQLRIERGEGRASADEREMERHSIAVLPFNNMSGDPEQEYFSDGITEDIITDLSKISALFVPSRHSVFVFKGKAVKVQQIARELDTAFVLEGSVRKVGGRVRITAQLIDGRTGGHIWADRYDRELDDIFAIQDDITRTIVEQLKVKLLPAEKKVLAHAPTANVEAYNYYLRGRQLLHRHSKSYLEMSRRMFAKAAELDPLYARAYAGIADCDSLLLLHYHEDVSVESILAITAKALELEAGLAEAHASRGSALSVSGRHDEAEAEFEEALALDPNLFEAAFFYSGSCVVRGKFQQAAALLERAAEIKPDDYQCLVFAISAYRSLRQDEAMRRAAERGLERAERALTLHPDEARAAYLGAIAFAAIGESKRALDWVSRALAIDPDDQVALYNIACVYTELGEIEPALDILERLLTGASHFTKAWAKHDSSFRPLRSNPRWQEVLKLAE